jgi:hypothetical protein
MIQFRLVSHPIEPLQNVTTNHYENLIDLHFKDHCNYSTQKYFQSSMAVVW